MNTPQDTAPGRPRDHKATDVRRPAYHAKGLLAACSIFLVCLGMTALGWRVSDQNSLSEAQQRFEYHCAEMEIAIQKRLKGYELVLQGGLALFVSVRDVDQSTWRKYAGELKLDTHYLGIQGLGYAPFVTDAHKREYLDKVRAAGRPDYDISPPGDRAEYTPIRYLEPDNFRNRRAVGYDMFSNPVRRDAMELCRDTGLTTITGKVTLVQETDTDIQAGFLMYLPYYAPNVPLDTPEARRAAFLGYIYSAFRMNDFMHGVMGGRAQNMDLKIYDGQGFADSDLMYDSYASKTESARERKSLFAHTDELKLYEHTWTLHFKSTPAFEATRDRKTPKLVLTTGLSISILVFFIALSLANTQNRALILADQMTAALRESEEKSRLILDSTGEAIYGVDVNGLCTFCNPASIRVLGYSRPEDLLGKNMHDLIHHTHLGGDPYDVHDCLIYKALRGGSGRHVDGEVFWRADGTSFPVEYWAYPQVRDGVVVGVAVAFQDVTEKQRVREALERANERLALAVESGQMGVWDWDILKDSMMWDARMYALYGIDKQGFSGVYDAWATCLHPEDRTRTESALRLALSGENDFGSEFRVVWPNGQVHYLKAYARIVRDDTGRPVRMTGVNLDVTAQKLAEQDLRESEEKFRAMSEASYDALIMIDTDDTVLFWSGAAERLFGYTRREAEGRRLHKLIALPEDQIKAYDGMGAFARTGHGPVVGGIGEFTATRKGGEQVLVERSVSSFRMRGKWYAVGSLRDVTERRKMERLKKEFISTVSHELRTPLTSIHGSLGLILGAMSANLPEQVGKLLNIASNNTTRLIGLINDILDLEKIESGKMQYVMEPINLEQAVRSSIEENQSYASGYHVRLEGRFSDEEVYVTADRNRLAQVMANLLSNAAKFSPPGEMVEVGITSSGNTARVWIRDKGPGISDEFKGRIFQKFAQADSSDTRLRGGTGLGLSISKLIVESFGGSIGFESEPGQGSVFHFDLPLCVPRDVSESTAPPARETPLQSGKTGTLPQALHVEDDKDIRDVVALVLKDTVEISQAGTLARARELLADKHYDLVLLDIQLPDGSGVELLDDIGKTPVLVFAVEGLASDALGRVRGVLLKSKTDNATLLAMVNKLLGRDSV